MLTFSRPTRLLCMCLLAPMAICSAATGMLAGHDQDAVQPAPPPRQDESLPAARDILNKSIQAMGGEQALSGLKTSTAHCMIDHPQMMQTTIEMHWMKPNRVLIRQSTQGTDTSMGFDGETAWMVTPLGARILPDEVAMELAQQANMFGMLLHFRDDMKSITTVEKLTFNGAECYRIELVSETGPVAFAYIHAADHLLVGLQRGASGSPQMTLNRFSEWKETAGIVHFTRIDIEQQGQSVPLVLKTVEFNSTDESLFVVPEEIKTMQRAEPESTNASAATADRDER